MLFSSITFIYLFLPVFIAIYYLTGKRLKNVSLLMLSLLFYSLERPAFLLLMLGSIMLAYVNGLLINKYKSKFIFFFAILCCLAPLLYHKYTDFFIENVNTLCGTTIKPLRLILPLGISFYTFQILSYLIDVKRERVPVERNLLNLALYISFFPQLVAGPIVTYDRIYEQLKKRMHSLEKFYNGIQYFSIGLGKKILLANQLGEFCSHYIPGTDILMTWTYAIAYSLQIYFDFSGYSDMAVGLGKMFGFELPQNFNYPFICSTIKDFWKRWHITLSSFFRDYVYIPLGGSRCSNHRHIFNLFVVWFLTGMWHGASWNFICWGLLFFILLILEKYIIKERLNPILHRILSLFFVAVSFLIFGADSMQNAWIGIRHLFSGSFISKDNLFLIYNYLFLIAISIIGATPLPKKIYSKFKNQLSILEPVFVVIILLASTAYLVNGSFNPFLYFRF